MKVVFVLCGPTKEVKLHCQIMFTLCHVVSHKKYNYDLYFVHVKYN